MTRRPFTFRPLRLELSALVLTLPSTVAAQQCLGLTPTTRTRALLSQEASRGDKGTVDRTRLMVALSRAMALTASTVRTSYLDTQGEPWEARGLDVMMSVEGPTQAEPRYRLCPTIALSGLRSNVANWVNPQEWKLVRFAPGIAAGRPYAVHPDFTIVPYAQGTFVLESFETLQPTRSRATRSYAVAEFGVGVTLYKAFVLRLSLPVPLGRGESYPGPYALRIITAGVALLR